MKDIKHKKELGYCWSVMSKSNDKIWDWFHTKRQAECWLLDFIKKYGSVDEKRNFKIQKVFMTYNITKPTTKSE